MPTKSELIASIHLQMKQNQFPDLPRQDIHQAVDQILSYIGETIADGNRVEIRGFGVFSYHDLSARQGRNPRTGESVLVPSKRTFHFKPGKELREMVDIHEGQGIINKSLSGHFKRNWQKNRFHYPQDLQQPEKSAKQPPKESAHYGQKHQTKVTIKKRRTAVRDDTVTS
ncbi:histone family protein DNA-binding protein [Acidithiobacillus ferrivorans SS3]|uniref:Histone family protein DNA-binding protein n=1 Tax=Acidithiobacillus ferrivorans SS3 TaxID=743299 RepID=G0JSM9_9PROT|nr:HU family DNA-binding protein [Acidithiobacillus ferrivorans]AEM46586.1 histone family protein DNA-binding protein [Acidithiobacillus ferrivorans SS3]